MSKIVGRKPVEIKIYDQQDGRIPVFDSTTRLWTTIDRNTLTSGSAITSGSNIFIGEQTISGSLNISGSITVNQGITGNLTGTASYASNAWAIGGNIFTGGSPERIIGTLSDHNLAIYASGSRVATFTSSGSLLISPNLPNNLNDEKILIDAGETTSINLIRTLSSIDNYSQIIITNQNSGSSASSDIVATADNGSENSNYIDMGINSSTFTGSIGDANDAYLYSTGNHLHIGNASNQYVGFFAGSDDVDVSMKLLLDPSNSHQMTGSLDVSGSVIAQSFTGSLFGTASYATQALTSSNATTASYVLNAQSASYWSGSIINAATASYVLNAVSASYATSALTASNANTASYVLNAQSASYWSGSILNATSASYAATSSYANNFTVAGTLTAQTLVVQTITSSTEFITGSTKNGSLLSNTHQFTGSVGVTGSLTVNGSDYITTSGSASTRLTALETFSGSYNTGSFTGSFIGRHTGSFSGSLYNLQNTVLGHIPFYSSSQVLADSIMRQIDNGSGSFSIVINQDGVSTSAPEALYVWQPSSTSYNVISGKGNLNSYLQLNIQNLNTGDTASSDVVASANNATETANYVDMGINGENFTPKGEYSVGGANDSYLLSTGRHHYIGSATSGDIKIFTGDDFADDNIKLLLKANDQHELTGSLSITGGITASLHGTASWADNAVTASYVTQALSASYWSGSIINAETASYVETAQTASYVLQAQSASYATTAESAPDYLPLAGGTLTGDLYAAGRTFWYQDLILGYGTTGGKITTDGSKYISIMPNYNVESARFWPNGNVTIQDAGTYVDNGFRLDVSGSGRFTDGLTVTGSLSTTEDATIRNAYIGLISAFGSNYTSFSHISRNGTNDYSLLSDNAGITYLNAKSGSDLKFRIDNIDKVVIDSNGNLGINKTSTNAKFDVDGNSIITGSLVVTNGITGSLFGTASYAVQALSASYWSGSITNAVTASYIETAQTASYVIQAQSASYWSGSITNAATASYVLNAVSSSFASTASSVNRLNQNVVISGSLTVTGSTNIIGNSGTTLLSSNADTLVFTGSLFTTGSIVSTGSLNILGGVTGSLLGTASYATQALSASYWSGSIINAATASYVQTAQTASYVLNAVSASYASTASYINPISNSYLVLSQVSQSLNFADDTAAAAGGVPLGGLYRNGNFILIRIV